MENFEQVRITKGNSKLTTNCSLCYDSLNIVVGDENLRNRFMKAIDNNSDDYLDVYSNISGCGICYIEPDINILVRNICDDIYALSRLSNLQKNSEGIIFLIDFGKIDNSNENLLIKLKQLVRVAEELNILLVIGVDDSKNFYFSRPSSYNVLRLSFAGKETYLNTDKIKIVLDDATHEYNLFYEIGYNKISLSAKTRLVVEDLFSTLLNESPIKYHKFKIYADNLFVRKLTDTDEILFTDKEEEADTFDLKKASMICAELIGKFKLVGKKDMVREEN